MQHFVFISTIDARRTKRSSQMGVGGDADVMTSHLHLIFSATTFSLHFLYTNFQRDVEGAQQVD